MLESLDVEFRQKATCRIDVDRGIWIWKDKVPKRKEERLTKSQVKDSRKDASKDQSKKDLSKDFKNIVR